MTRRLVPLALAAAATGCGNYSTEDLRFLAALPQREELSVAVPASTGAGPAALTGLTALSAACAGTLGDAEVWRWAKPTSDNLSRAVDWIVGLVDAVRRYPPTDRSDDSRRWGPFDAERHPGREIQVVIDRSWPAGPDGPPTYAYRFEARVKGTATFTPLLWGTFEGASAATGDGTVTLDFQRFWALGINDPDTPYGSLAIDYSRSSDPVTTELDLNAGPAGGFDVESFNYAYAGWAGGSGAFDYKFRNAAGDVLQVATSYAATGEGRLQVLFTRAGDLLPAGSFRQCWDASACLVYVDDPLDLSCGTSPCSDTSTPTACVDVPAPPFPVP